MSESDIPEVAKDQSDVQQRSTTPLKVPTHAEPITSLPQAVGNPEETTEIEDIAKVSQNALKKLHAPPAQGLSKEHVVQKASAEFHAVSITKTASESIVPSQTAPPTTISPFATEKLLVAFCTEQYGLSEKESLALGRFIEDSHNNFSELEYEIAGMNPKFIDLFLSVTNKIKEPLTPAIKKLLDIRNYYDQMLQQAPRVQEKEASPPKKAALTLKGIEQQQSTKSSKDAAQKEKIDLNRDDLKRFVGVLKKGDKDPSRIIEELVTKYTFGESMAKTVVDALHEIPESKLSERLKIIRAALKRHLFQTEGKIFRKRGRGIS